MTKKDYVAIAAVVAGATYTVERDAAGNALVPADVAYAQGTHAAREIIAADLANVFAADNPQFDRAKFLSACGVH
ncbi:MAG: hypothetical protein KGI71_06645 [Patescibacteria group bacterium]|nr:hypothetical protein [Patescibacteria group bacterium]